MAAGSTCWRRWCYRHRAAVSRVEASGVGLAKLISISHRHLSKQVECMLEQHYEGSEAYLIAQE